MTKDTFLDNMNIFQSVLKKKNIVINDGGQGFQSTTFFTDIKILGVIYPESREEVQECVKLANQYNLKIYPISTGKNIGFGGGVPTDDNCVIMNLGKMNKIIEYNETLAYVTLEPGVTQKQLVDFLEENNSNLMHSITASFQGSSIIGNCLERGNTLGPLLERAEHICNFGVVLSSGRYINTGYGRFSNSKVKHLNKYGLGPDISGLFIQSNLGIITEMTVWLSPKPKALENLMFNTTDFNQLERTLDKIRSLKLQDIINEAFLWNDYKLTSLIQRYPFNLSNENFSLQNWLMNFKKKHQVGDWNGAITLRSSSKPINFCRKIKIYKTLLKSVNFLISTKGAGFKLLRFSRTFIKNIFGINLGPLIKVADSPIFAGKPSDLSISSIYWRKPEKQSLIKDKTIDPERDKVGFIWCDVALPLVGIEIVNTVKGISSIIASSSFEPMLGIICTNKRYALLVTGITYDRDIQGEDSKAMGCHDKVLKYLTKQGHYPSRLGIQSMNKISSSNKDYEKIIKNLKNHLDPQNILSPGRYDFRSIIDEA